MNQRLVQLSLVVNDYDEAIAYYTGILEFDLVEDTTMSETKRWVVVRPKGDGSCSLLLAKAVGEEQQKAVGNQTGGRVFLFLHTDDFYRDYNKMVEKGVEFVRGPSEEAYGRVAVFRDLYGNLWDFIQPNSQ
jgi:catechol 2,3-dioxygenase-like lactoylglutathione lyase family enzyme